MSHSAHTIENSLPGNPDATRAGSPGSHDAHVLRELETTAPSSAEPENLL